MALQKSNGNDPVTQYKPVADDVEHVEDVESPRLTKRPYLRTGRYLGQYLDRKLRRLTAPRAM